MNTMQVKKMTTQVMVDETLILNGEVISFADEYLTMIRVRTKGRQASVFRVTNEGREFSTTKDNAIRVVKVSGIIRKVNMRIKGTNERIDAVLMDDGSYAVFSTNDLDEDALTELGVDSAVFEGNADQGSHDVHHYTTNTGDNRRGCERHLEFDENGCDGYDIIRMNARFDSEFCTKHGGNYTAAVSDIEDMVAAISEYYETSPGLCMEVQLCGLS